MTTCDEFAYAPAPVTGPFTLMITERAVPATVTSLSLRVGVEVAGAGPHNGVNVYYRWYDQALTTLSTALLGSAALGSYSDFTLAAPPYARYFDISVDPGGVAMTDLVYVRGTVDCSSGGLGYCDYGTRAKGSTTSGIIITTGLIDILISAIGLSPWIAVVFDTFVGKVLWGGDLCSGLPPSMPVFTNADFVGGAPNIADPVSRDKFWSALLAIAWPYFCECVPGPLLSPPFVAPPPPALVKPDAAPLSPQVIDCDGTDLCAAFNDIARQLVAVSSQITNLRTDVTLIQRQSVPFAYLAGTVHTGLTDSGQFAVQGILAISVHLTTRPGRLGEEAGNPIAYFEAGWVTSGTADGWRLSVPIRHDPLWVEVSPEDTLIGYSLTPNVAADISEFTREP